MKTSTKRTLMAAVICILAGLLVLFCTAVSVGFDLRKINTVTFDKKTTAVTERFDSMKISGFDSNVTFVLSDNDETTVTSFDSDGITTDITVKNGTLLITREDNRPWYEHISISFSSGNDGITISLPEKEYKTLNVTTLSGDITLPDGLCAERIRLESTSGSLRCQADIIEGSQPGSEDDGEETFNLWLKTVSGDVTVHNAITPLLKIDTTSGDISVSGGYIEYSAKIESTSGEIELSEMSGAMGIAVNTTSGEIELENLKATRLYLRSVSGDIGFEDCDAAEIEIKTNSGDVDGAFLTGKIYNPSTKSGNVRVPASDPEGGTCTVTTTSGNITIKES